MKENDLDFTYEKKIWIAVIKLWQVFKSRFYTSVFWKNDGTTDRLFGYKYVEHHLRLFDV